MYAGDDGQHAERLDGRYPALVTAHGTICQQRDILPMLTTIAPSTPTISKITAGQLSGGSSARLAWPTVHSQDWVMGDYLLMA
jgi:hypothetical protein